MSVPVSSVPAVCAYVHDQLSSLLTPTAGYALQVSYDDFDSVREGDIVVIGGVEHDEEPFALVGGYGNPGSMREHYRLSIVITCYRGGDDGTAVRAAAWGMRQQVRDWVNGPLQDALAHGAAPVLTTVYAARISGSESSGGKSGDDRARWHQITCTVFFDAVL